MPLKRPCRRDRGTAQVGETRSFAPDFCARLPSGTDTLISPAVIDVVIDNVFSKPLDRLAECRDVLEECRAEGKKLLAACNEPVRDRRADVRSKSGNENVAPASRRNPLVTSFVTLPAAFLSLRTVWLTKLPNVSAACSLPSLFGSPSSTAASNCCARSFCSSSSAPASLFVMALFAAAAGMTLIAILRPALARSISFRSRKPREYWQVCPAGSGRRYRSRRLWPRQRSQPAGIAAAGWLRQEARGSFASRPCYAPQ